ncbi:MAG: 30S ribosomal protein S20 [Alphaproteobacteria bacterium]|nr:30S ribosomal protein S20 [Alphaproteobacteria bacterium]
MANHKSAAKRARQSLKRNTLNRARRSKVHTLVKAVETAIAGKDDSAAKKAMRAAESGLARASNRGTVHWKTAARKTSRLARRVKSAQQKSGKA